jgi:hypothetical protein
MKAPGGVITCPVLHDFYVQRQNPNTGLCDSRTQSLNYQGKNIGDRGVVLGIELRASCLLYHKSQPLLPSQFFGISVYFLDRISHFCPGWSWT